MKQPLQQAGVPRRAPGRPRGFERPEALQRALALFCERGYEGASVAELTAAMGITPPSLYAAFGSKEALYREALALYRAGPGGFAARALQEEPTARRAIARLLREAAALFPSGAVTAGCMISMAALCCAPEHRGVAEHATRLRGEALAALEARIAAGIAGGELPPGSDAAGLARFYGAVIQGMSIQARDGAGCAELLQIAEAALAAWPAAGVAGQA